MGDDPREARHRCPPPRHAAISRARELLLQAEHELGSASSTSAFLPLISSGFGDDECSAQTPAFRKPSSDETMGQLLLAWAFVSGVSEGVA
jgi:hypothetical protein